MRFFIVVALCVVYSAFCYGMMQLPELSKEECQKRDKSMRYVRAQVNRMLKKKAFYAALMGCLKQCLCLDTGDSD